MSFDWITLWLPDLGAAALLFLVHAFYLPISNWIFGDDISARMRQWRSTWARQALWRGERITDVGLVRGLIAGVSFFATTSVLVISGLLATLNSVQQISSYLLSVPFAAQTSTEITSFKIGALLLLAVSAFFKFGWSMRLHSYSLLMIGSMPEPDERQSEKASAVADRLANLSYLASKHFHSGVRAYYLGFSALTWILSVWLFLPVLVIVVGVMIRRDYRSAAFELSAPI